MGVSRHGLAIALSALLLAGCSRLTPVPEPYLQDWPQQLGPQSQTLASAWWQGFSDEALNQWISTGLQQNYSLQAAWARLAQSEAVWRQASSDQYPDLSLSASRSREWREGVTSDLWSAGLSTEYELDFWGRISALDEQGRLRAQASLANTRVQASTVAANIALNWYGLRMQNANLALLAEQQQRVRAGIQISQARFRRGQADITDVWQQEQLLENLNAEQITARAERDRYQQQLALWVAQPQWLDNDQLLTQVAGLPELPEAEGVALAALQQRPDVQEAWWTLQAANAGVAAAVANRFPRLTLTASYRSQESDASQLFDDWIGNLAGALLLPLIDGGNRRAAVAQQQAAVDEALAAYQQTLLTAMQEVRQALTGAAQMSGRSASLARQLQLARETEAFQNNRYRKGSGDFLSLLTAQREVLTLEQQLLSSRWQQLQYRIQLYRAVSHGDFAHKDTSDEV